MSHSPDHPGDPLRELRHAVVPVDGPEAAARRREQTISHMRAVQLANRLQRTATRRWQQRLAIAAAVFVPSLAAATWATFHRTSAVQGPTVTAVHRGPNLRVRHGTVTVAHANGVTETAVAGTEPLAFTAADRLRTDGDTEASVELPSGAAVVVSPATELRVDTERASLERVELASGRVDVKVPKLEPGKRLVVDTADSAVIVHGTRFTVEASGLLDDNAPSWTRVAVREGVVAVEHDGRSTELRAGDAWSSKEPSAGTGQPAPTGRGIGSVRPLHEAATAPLVPAPVGKLRALPRGAANASSLGVENTLMQRALGAAKAGDDTRAVALLDEIITRYPNSPLEPNAEVEKFRALQRLGKVTQAAKQARRYLGDHPDGMGSDEARRIAVEPIAPARGGSERSR